jgi:hypothetical protein
VDSLNDALVWLTIEGAAPKYDVQLWLSTYGIAQSEVRAIEKKWSSALTKLLR